MSSLIVPATVGIVVGITELDRIVVKKQGPTVKPLIAGFILGLGLYGISGLDAQLGQLFCILVILTALLENAKPLLAISKGITG